MHFALALALTLAAQTAEPIAPAAPAQRTPRPLAWSPAADVSLTAVFAALWLTSEYAFKSQLAPTTCHWCATNALDLGARGIRAPTLAGQKTADAASGVFSYVLAPVVALGLDWVLTWRGNGTWKDAAVDTLLVLEAVMLSQTINQSVKFIAGRERPFVAALSADEKLTTSQPVDNNLSFYSGHTAFAFSVVAASATVARLRGSSKWWVILAAGLPIAATAGILRMVADKHYLSDVVNAAGISSAIAIAIPMLFHRPIDVGPVHALVVPTGPGVSLVGRF